MSENTNIHKPPLKIRYAGFTERVIASLIDTILSGLFFFPLFSLMSNMLYGKQVPMQVLLQSLSEQAKKTENFMDALNVTLSDPIVMQALSRSDLTWKYIFEQVVQITIVGSIIYLFWRKKQATPGKMLLSMKIVDDKTMQAPSRKQVMLRFIGYIPSTIFLCLGFVWILFNKRKKGWHDYIAGTVVIKY